MSSWWGGGEGAAGRGRRGAPHTTRTRTAGRRRTSRNGRGPQGRIRQTTRGPDGGRGTGASRTAASHRRPYTTPPRRAGDAAAAGWRRAASRTRGRPPTSRSRAGNDRLPRGVRRGCAGLSGGAPNPGADGTTYGFLHAGSGTVRSWSACTILSQACGAPRQPCLARPAPLLVFAHAFAILASRRIVVAAASTVALRIHLVPPFIMLLPR